jgi:protein involved in polysaccharide export with SLBB domain
MGWLVNASVVVVVAVVGCAAPRLTARPLPRSCSHEIHVVVLGRVRSPGVVASEPSMSIAQAIERAGGLDGPAWRALVRRVGCDGRRYQTSVPIHSLGEPDLPRLELGDEVMVLGAD